MNFITNIKRGLRISFSIAGIFCMLIGTPNLFAQRVVKNQSSKKDNPLTLKLSTTEYEDRLQAIWVGQIVAVMMGWPFEHQTAYVERINQLPGRITYVPVDDDWYYEMVAVRAFEKYGIDLTVQQLEQQWKENTCGIWGSTKQARILLNKDILPPETGRPKYNHLWFKIGLLFSAVVYGALAPGLPNVAAKMAREYGHLNGYAEGVDGAVFIAGMISIGFYEKDPQQIVCKAATLISSFKGQTIKIRLYQRVLIQGKEVGNANWKNIEIK